MSGTFTTCPDDSVDIYPIVQKKRPVADSNVQTEPVLCDTKDVQIPEMKNSQVQTDVKEIRRISTVEYEPEALLDFLNRVTPTICSFLEQNGESHAFDNYIPLSDIEATSTRLIHCLRNKALDQKFFAAATSWNSTGTALAIAYTTKDHKDWCHHDSVIAVWNFHRKNFNSQKPTTIIETDCCITSIAFHPEEPAVIAGGKFNGEVFVCNIAKDDDVPTANSGNTLSCHREPISSIFWGKEDKTRIITSCLDGKILIWKYFANKNQLQLVDGLIVLAEDISRNLGIKSVRPDAEVGVTCMTVNNEDPSIFVIGTEGGGVFQCNFKSMAIRPYIQSPDALLKSPITISFERHPVCVNSVHFSPFSRNIFLTAGSEGEIRIYTLLQTKPVIVINLIVGIQEAQWSMLRPLVIAAVTNDGKFHMIDLGEDLRNPVESIVLNEDKISASCINFNIENPQWICTATTDGSIQVWTLGNSFTSAESDEIEQLAALVKRHD